MTKRYFHEARDERYGNTRSTKDVARLLDYGGRKVLAVLKVPSDPTKPSFAVVPGFVLGGSWGKIVPESRIRVTDVEPIIDPMEIKELTDLVIKNFPGQTERTVSFWDKD